MLYVVAGNGTGPTKEITAALKDLKDKATKDDVEFWVILEGKDDPTTTDNAIVNWLVKNETWFEIYSPTGTTYEGAQETHATEDVFASFLERIQERAEESEDAVVLILPADESGESDEDEALMVFVEQAIDADVPVHALNGEMAPITLGEDETQPEPEPEPEPEPAPAPAKKATAKKAAAPAKSAAKKAAGPAKKAAATAANGGEGTEDSGAEDEPADEGGAVVYNRAELTKMGLPELGAVARSQGIEPKGLDKRTLVEEIMKKMTPEAVVAASAASTASTISTNGDGDDEVLVIVVPRSKLAALLS
jgi:hypothetical protein